MKRTRPQSGHGPASCRGPSLDLPVDLLAQVLACLSLPERLELALVSKTWAAAVRHTIHAVAVDLRQRTRNSIGCHMDLASSVGTLALVTPAATAISGSTAAAAALAGGWEPEEARLWCRAAGKPRPAAAAWHLRRAVAAVASGGAAHAVLPRRPRSLSLLLVAPEMDASTSELHRMLVTAGVEGQISCVAMPQGLLRLDGRLNRQLTRANVVAAGLPAALQASPPYARLEHLALKLCADDDLPAILGAIHSDTLPALRCLALLAPTGAAVSADIGALRHPTLTRLDLRGLQLTAGFASLQHLSGLEALAVRYEEEDEAPPLNLAGDLSALAPLKQLSALALDNLGRGDGLPALTQLTSLSLAPQQGARITLRGLARLHRLSVDLSAGSCGRDLLSLERSTVYVPASGHGLHSLQQLELRCFVWRHWEAAGSDHGGSDHGGSDHGGSDDSSSASSSDGSSVALSDGGSSVAGDGDGEDVASSAASEASSDGEEIEDNELEVGAEAAGAAEEQEEEAEQEVEEEADVAEPMVDGGDGAPGEAEDEAAAGLLEASWGFLQHGNGSSSEAAGSGGGQQAHAMMSLEQRYVSALVARLPSLQSIQLVDYMGLVDPAPMHAASLGLQGGKPGTALGPQQPAAAAAPAPAGKESASGSRSGTPGLVLQQETGGMASSVAGWQRAVAETPVPGGISQYDVIYTLCGSADVQ